VDVSGRGTASIEANEVGQGTSKQQRETLWNIINIGLQWGFV
jgi:hypothetical protein